MLALCTGCDQQAHDVRKLAGVAVTLATLLYDTRITDCVAVAGKEACAWATAAVLRQRSRGVSRAALKGVTLQSARVSDLSCLLVARAAARARSSARCCAACSGRGRRMAQPQVRDCHTNASLLSQRWVSWALAGEADASAVGSGVLPLGKPSGSADGDHTAQECKWGVQDSYFRIDLACL